MEKGKIKTAVEAVKAADSKTALKVLRMRNDEGDFVEMGFAWGGVGQMSLNAETEALTIRNLDPATDSEGGGGGGGFTGDTRVLMADGSRHEIGDIVPGDMVLGYDFQAGQPVPAMVSRVYHGLRDHHYVMNGGLRVTGEHPFCSGLGEFTRVKELRERDSVLGFSNEETDELQGIGIKSLELVSEGSEIFNITVDDVATFCAMSSGESFLVHNKGGGAPEGGSKCLRWRGRLGV